MSVVAIPLLLIIITQLLWPANRLLPFQKIDGVDVGLLNADGASVKLREIYDKQTLSLVNNAEVEIMNTTLAGAGIEIEVGEQITEASNYPLWQRLIPLSAVLRMFGNVTTPPHVVVGDEQIMNMASGTVADAEIVVQDDQLSVKPSQVGFAFAVDELRRELTKLRPSTSGSLTIKLDTEVAIPDIVTEEAQLLVDEINQHTGGGLDLTFEDQTFAVDRTTLLSWLVFPKNTEIKKLEVQVARENLEKYVNEQLAPKVNIAAKNTVVNTYNGRETGRTNGVNGRTVDVDKLLAAVSERLLGDDDSAIELETAIVVAQVTYNRSYSNDFGGLQHELADRYAGKAYAMYVINLANNQALLQVNPDRVFTAASTYKLYVAYSMLLAVESGEVTWDTPLNGTTLAICFDKMIVNSDNACPKAWLDWKTYKRVTQEARSIGASSTCLGCGNGQSTTARDLANFLSKIYNGSILTTDSRTRLIGAMKRNVYRQGIPQGIGSNGTVADKVGFLNGLLHDAAIVYSNKGDYVVIIMTDGYSWASIAETTKKIYQQL
jgi:beta-lactamase class A